MSLTKLPLSMMADGTDGNLITYNASGVASAVSTGSSGQVLKSAGAGSAPSFGASGGYTFVQELTASSSSDLKFEGLSGDFDYKIIAKKLNNSADAHIDVELGASTTYITANYQYEVFKAQQDAMTSAGNDGSGQSAMRITIATMGAGAGEVVDGYFEFFNLADSSEFASMFGHYLSEDAGGTEHMLLVAGRYEVDAALTDIKFKPSTGSFTDGKLALFKRPNA